MRRNVEAKDSSVAGMMATTCLIFGIFSGVCFSFLVVFFINEAGGTVVPGFVCPTDDISNGTSTASPWNVTGLFDVTTSDDLSLVTA